VIYHYEIVDPELGVIKRWDLEHPSDDHALAGLKGVPLLDDESARAFRGDEVGPFATRTADFGVEVLA
jgi:hypothetical protein